MAASADPQIPALSKPCGLTHLSCWSWHRDTGSPIPDPYPLWPPEELQAAERKAAATSSGAAAKLPPCFQFPFPFPFSSGEEEGMLGPNWASHTAGKCSAAQLLFLCTGYLACARKPGGSPDSMAQIQGRGHPTRLPHLPPAQGAAAGPCSSMRRLNGIWERNATSPHSQIDLHVSPFCWQTLWWPSQPCPSPQPE